MRVIEQCLYIVAVATYKMAAIVCPTRSAGPMGSRPRRRRIRALGNSGMVLRHPTLNAFPYRGDFDRNANAKTQGTSYVQRSIGDRTLTTPRSIHFLTF